MNKRKNALLTGWALVVMAILAGFSLGYAFPEFNQTGNLESLRHLIQARQALYVSMLVGLFLIVLLDLLVSYTLYHYFKEVNKTVSFIAAIFRILYTLFFGVAMYFLIGNAANHELSNLQIHQNFDLFETIWNCGLVIFGFHLILIGYLMMVQNTIYKLLVYLMFLAGASYVIVHFLKGVTANLEIVANLELILAFPMAIGELGLAIWLIVKGGKSVAKASDSK